MKKNKFSETRKKNIKCTACIESMPASKIYSFSKMMRKKLVTKRQDPVSTENKNFEVQAHKEEKYDNVVNKTPILSLPTLIRIRTTDREGNTFEVTY